MAQQRVSFMRASNMFVMLLVACFLTAHVYYNHSMVQRSEGRLNAKLQALQREVQTLRQQVQDQHLLPSPGALGSALAVSAGTSVTAALPGPSAAAGAPPQAAAAASAAGGPAPAPALLPQLPAAAGAAGAAPTGRGSPDAVQITPLGAPALLPLPPVKWKATQLNWGNNVPKLLKLEPKEAIRLGPKYVEWQANFFERRGGQMWSGARSTGDKKKIERIWVWGERNSCTTIMMAILKRNFVLGCEEGMSPGNLTRCGLRALQLQRE